MASTLQPESFSPHFLVQPTPSTLIAEAADAVRKQNIPGPAEDVDRGLLQVTDGASIGDADRRVAGLAYDADVRSDVEVGEQDGDDHQVAHGHGSAVGRHTATKAGALRRNEGRYRQGSEEYMNNAWGSGQ